MQARETLLRLAEDLDWLDPCRRGIATFILFRSSTGLGALKDVARVFPPRVGVHDAVCRAISVFAS